MSTAIKEIYNWVDGRINVKGVYRRLQVVARLLVVGTFADDSLRVACDYSGQVSTMGSVGFRAPLSSILPAVFILTQGISVFLIISELAPEPGCITLLVWTGLHPYIYKQESNLEFLLESVTIMGGLMVLLSSERQNRKARERKLLPSVAPTPEETAEEANKMNLLQLCGRVCISAVFLYYGGKMMHERVQGISKGLAAGGKSPPPCLRTAPHLLPGPSKGLGARLRTAERRLGSLGARRGRRSSPQAAPMRSSSVLPFHRQASPARTRTSCKRSSRAGRARRKGPLLGALPAGLTPHRGPPEGSQGSAARGAPWPPQHGRPH